MYDDSKLREAIYAIVGKRTDECFCKECSYKRVGLVDVLIALEKHAKPYPIVGALNDGEFVINGDRGGVYEGTGIYWDLTKEFDDQSDKVKEFLAGVICPHV